MLDNDQILKNIFKKLNSSINEFSGIILLKNNAVIEYISPSFAEFLFSLDSEAVIGENINELMPHSDVSEVLKTGSPKLASRWNIKDQEIIVSTFPVKQGHNVIGALVLIIFNNIKDALYFARRITDNSEQITYYKREVQRLWGAKYSLNSIIGNSLPIIEAKRQAWDIAATHSPVLITGETGTGKELFAHAIHHDSSQNGGPFVIINCAAIPDNLVESELFGYEAGSFTGAKKGGKPGKFELANNGTIFLDEISELPLYMQAKLLRVLQEHEVERVGGISMVSVNVRVISATNKNLKTMVNNGVFREDLYYRLNVFSVKVPALRERLEDIPILSDFFISEFNQEVGTTINGLNDSALQVLMNYRWPGNVRELKSTIERACLDAKRGLIKPENLYYIKDELNENSNDEIIPLKIIRMSAERAAIVKALKKTSGNKNKACELLEINRTTFYKRLKELNIEDIY